MLTQTNNFKISLNSFYLFPIIVIIMRLTPQLVSLSYVFLAAYCFFGRKQIIQALILSWFFTMINPTIAPRGELIHLLRYLVIFSAFSSILFKNGFFRFDSITLYTLLLGIFIVFHSLIFSSMPSVSLLKIFSWMIVMITLLKAWSGLDIIEHERMQNWIISFILFMTLLGLPFLLIPEIGYARNSDGFQGVLNQPQVFGTTTALVAAVLLGKLFKHNRPPWLLIITIISLFILIFISETRTAGIGLFFASIITMVLFFIVRILQKKDKIRISKRLFFFIIISIYLLLIFNSYISESFIYFISKGNVVEVDNFFDAFFISRGGLIYPMLENINENFLNGTGFGIASDPTTMKIRYDPIMNIPIGASAEKGVLPIMVLEEIGIFGFIFFSLWIYNLFYRAIKNGFEALILLITIFLLNMGEAVLFSPGGHGLLFLILLTSIITKSSIAKNSSALGHIKN